MTKKRTTFCGSLPLGLAGLALAWLAILPQGLDAQIYGCYTCTIIAIPDPNGGSFREPLCWDFGDGHGWRSCSEVGSTCWLAYSCTVFTGGLRQVELTLPGEFPIKESILLVDVGDITRSDCNMVGVQRIEPAPPVTYTF